MNIERSIILRLGQMAERHFVAGYKPLLVGTVIMAFAIPLALVATPFIEFFNGMAAQPKARSQMTYGRVYGENHLVERSPVSGTVHRAFAPYEFVSFGATVEEAALIGDLLTNPTPRTMDAMQRGQHLFDIYCLVCHGTEAAGDGPATGPERFPAPPSLHTQQARAYEDGAIFHIITKGTAKMPSYADKLTPTERWQVVHYLRALLRAANPEPEDLLP